MSDNDFGAYPSHPGEVLKDEIEYQKISQRKLAENIVMSHTALNEILNWPQVSYYDYGISL